MHPVALHKTLDTRRLSDPAYLADAYAKRGDLEAAARVHLDRAVGAMLQRFADLSDRDHVVTVIRHGIDDRIDHDTTTLDWAEGAYAALVREGLVGGVG